MIDSRHFFAGGLLVGFCACTSLGDEPLAPYFAGGALPGTSSGLVFATGDIDGDGMVDAVGFQSRSFQAPSTVTVSVFRGIEDELLSGPETFSMTTETAAQGVDLVDVDGDGHLDLVCSTQFNPSLFVMKGTGDGGFLPLETLVTWEGNNHRGFQVGDLDGDGHPDIVTLNLSGGVRIYFGDGSGGFDEPVLLPGFSSNMNSMAIGDFESDGDLDIAVISNLDFGLWKNDGQGGFGSPIIRDIQGGVTRSLRMVDRTGDGLLDPVWLYSQSSHYLYWQVHSMTGVSTPATVTGFASYELAPQHRASPFFGDVNGDGQLDVLAVGGWYAPESSVRMLGNPDGTFTEPETFGPAFRVNGHVVGHDLNSDGRLDLVAASPSGIQTLYDRQPCPAEYSGDDQLNVFDIFAFIGLYQIQNRLSDFNSDGVYNFFDFAEYIAQFNAGCP